MACKCKQRRLLDDFSYTRGSGAYYGPGSGLEQLNPGLVPGQERYSYAPVPVVDPNAPRVLSTWPVDRSSLLDGPVVLKPYRYAEDVLVALNREVYVDALSWEQTWRGSINESLAGTGAFDANYMANIIGKQSVRLTTMLRSVVGSIAKAASDGLTGAAAAFGEVGSELQAWPGGVPDAVIERCIEYTKDWQLVCREAADRFKALGDTWLLIQNWMTQEAADERQLRQAAYAAAQIKIEELQARVAELEQVVGDLQKGGGLLGDLRTNFETLLKSGGDAVGKALTAIGKAVPDFIEGAKDTLGGLAGAALPLLIGVGALMFLSRK